MNFSTANLSLAYQPIRSIWAEPTDEANYFEVLLRVNGGSPIGFLSRLIAPEDNRQLDLWVAQQVCKRSPHHRYAINLSPVSLYNPQFIRLLMASSHRFVLEITEHHAASLVQTDVLLEICKRFPVMLDDIGSAYSGLNRLCSFSFEGIKIDGQLILQIEASMKARAIVGNLMRLAEDLGVCCICEFVETRTLWKLIQAIHAQYAPRLELYVQGWAVGMPTLFTDQADSRPTLPTISNLNP